MGKIMRSITGAPSPSKMVAQQQAILNQQIAAQKQMQLEAEQRAEERAKAEEAQRAKRAADEMRARMAAQQGRRGALVASNRREILNNMGVLG